MPRLTREEIRSEKDAIFTLFLEGACTNSDRVKELVVAGEDRKQAEESYYMQLENTFTATLLLFGNDGFKEIKAFLDVAFDEIGFPASRIGNGSCRSDPQYKTLLYGAYRSLLDRWQKVALNAE